MRILLVCERLESPGGWYTYARGLKKGLERRGHEVRTCTRRGLERGEYAILPTPIRCMTMPFAPRFAARRLRKVIAAVRPDVIHIVVEPYALLVPYLTREEQTKVVLTIHGSYGIRVLKEKWSKKLAERFYRQIPVFIAVSEYTKNAVAEALGNGGADFKRKTTVVKNGIAVPPYDARDKPATGRQKNILLAGGVKPRKGVREAIEACAIYREKTQTPFRFDIVGTCNENDPYVRSIRRRIGELQLSGLVHLHGQIPDQDISRLYGNADLYLMPAQTNENTFEGFGIVFIEANAYGVPCIGPETGGAAEAVEEGETGFHVDPENPAQIAERMTWILNDGKINSDACRAWAGEHSIERMVDGIEEVYRA